VTTVYLIRHAEAEGNLYRRAHGHYNSAITARGYRQIAALAKRFEQEHIDAVYSSDLVRTQTTALAIARVHGLPIRTTPELREVGVGVWEDRTWAWLARFDRERLVAFNVNIGAWEVEGGERMADVRDRMLRAVKTIAAAHPNETVAVFTHGMALRTLVGTLQGLSLAEIDKTPHAENTAVTKLVSDETGIRVLWRDDASHLPEELTTLRRQAWTKARDGVEPGVWFEPDAAAAGRFHVLCEDERVGTVAVAPGVDGVADLTELRLDASAQGRNLGIRLVGQAVSHARAQGCDTLRAVLPRENALGLHRMAEYGFRVAEETPERVTMALYSGYDGARRIASFDEAWAEVER